ncbi:unnamed protein product [Caenorhabditis auriculariae]|uniref:RRM domain-containing protein n=1 Tax=Caenorhabditis auriculariae TaxID=2777116 RepID=A0A8S1H843_9PELO|nr:unnamed protein product [Caenorhabditis auriculariae]
MSYYGFGGANEEGGYNARTHSKIAEKEGFHMGGSSDEPRTLYVGNLDPSVTEDFINTLFGQIGVVTKTKCIFDGSNDPYAFVEFADHNQAAAALQTMNRRSLLEKEMKVNWAVEPGTQQAKVDTSRHFHVFVGDLSPDVDNSVLKEAFAPFGEVSDAKVIRDTTTLKSKGYGFVSYPKREEAERAIEQMNGQWLGRRTIRTNWATRKPGQESQAASSNEKSYDEVYNQTTSDNTSVYVGNITGGTAGANIAEEEIRRAFGQFGRIQEVRVFRVQGYAFVKFDSKEAAAKAIMQMNGADLCGNALRCSWGKTGDFQSKQGGQQQGGGYGYGYGSSYGSGGGSSGVAANGYGYGGASGAYPTSGHAAANPAAAAGGAGGAANAQQQYWQYYAQYYNNPQLMQQWSQYWNQQGQGQGQGQNGGSSAR